MSAFDRVIGYDHIKTEMMELVDIIKNPEVYKSLGADLPSGVILEGDPGLGKTLFATCFIEECGISSYIIRRDKQAGEFISEMTKTFDTAIENAPSVILLDDMDKFAAEEKRNEEFTVLQSLIDSIKGKGVFLIATVNDTDFLPKSLLRAGRFDKHIFFRNPSKEDGPRIASYYIGKRPVGDSVDLEDAGKMLCDKSCAEIDSVINFAAISAAYERCERIEMRHLVGATLRKAYGVTNKCDKMTPEEKEQTAYHEAGHAVLSDIIDEGSVGLASICSSNGGDRGGFMLRCIEFTRRPHVIIVSLGGKAAYELKYGKIASGTSSDISKACTQIDFSVKRVGTYGLANLGFGNETASQDERSEIVVTAELERLLFKAKEILAENREFLDKVAAELLEKETLLNSDIARIRKSCTIKPAVIG